MPNKTIYVSDGDLSLYQRAQELAGGNLSAAISAALRRFVDQGVLDWNHEISGAGAQQIVLTLAENLELENQGLLRKDPTILSTVEIETDDGARTALSEIELDMFFMVLTVAGSETTRNAIAG